MPEAAVRFAAEPPGATSAVDPRCLVDGGVYDVRRVAVAPGATRGPGRYTGDACVCVLAGSVRFDVDGEHSA